MNIKRIYFSALTALALLSGGTFLTAQTAQGTLPQPPQASKDTPCNVTELGFPEGEQAGVCIRTLSGRDILKTNEKQNFVPASNLKVLSTGLSLHLLGADARFETRLAHSGEISPDGTLKGDLYIIGGGDPTLGSGECGSKGAEELVSGWVRRVREAGIRRIEGLVIGDSRAMPSEVNGSWMYEDIATYYGATPCALMYRENCIDLLLTPGTEVGAAVKINATGGGKALSQADTQISSDTGAPSSAQAPANATLTIASAPWMILRSECTTGEEGTGDRTYLYVSEFSPAARLSGTYALGKAPKTVHYNNPFPEFAAAFDLADALLKEGIVCRGVTSTSACHPIALYKANASEKNAPAGKNTTTDKNTRASAANSAPARASNWAFAFESFTQCARLAPQDSLTVIARTLSPKLSEIARRTNYVSDNLYAETLLRAVGAVPKASQAKNGTRAAENIIDLNGISTENAIDAELAALEELGVDTEGRGRIDDGSGLSRKNAVTPEFIVDYLSAISQSPAFPAFLASLPPSGESERLLAGAPQELRKRLRVKSGSMTGVLCYCGYILPAEGKGETIVFSIMVNDSLRQGSRIRAQIEAILLNLMR